RDKLVTGVQTCALPIWIGNLPASVLEREPLDQIVLVVVLGDVAADRFHQVEMDGLEVAPAGPAEPVFDLAQRTDQAGLEPGLLEIGRASCRERGGSAEV